MAQNIPIPGRRIQDGEEFRTDWVPRGGDCVILRIQVLVAAGGGGIDTVDFALETRGEDGTTINTLTPKGSAISVDTTGVKTALYVADTSSTAGNGAQEQVRVVVSSGAGGGGYFVVRVFPLIMFDSAKPY